MEEKRTNIFLVRHGETSWNLEKRWQGSKNSNLTSLGVLQAKKAKKLLDKFTIHNAYVSPLQRAQDTMNIILEDKKLDVVVLEDIRELNLGSWEGKTQEDTKVINPDEFYNFWHKPNKFSLEGAESFEDLQKRVVKGLDYIFSQHIGYNVIVVSHWISIKVAIAHYCSNSISILPSMDNPKNGELTCLSKVGNQVSLF